MDAITSLESNTTHRHHKDPISFQQSYKCNRCNIAYSKKNMLKIHQIIHDVDDKFSFNYGPSFVVENLENYFLSRRDISPKVKRTNTDTAINKKTSLSDIMNNTKNGCVRKSSAVNATTTVPIRTEDSVCCDNKQKIQSPKKCVSANTKEYSKNLININNNEHYRKRWLPSNIPENEVYDVGQMQPEENRYISNQREINSEPVTNKQHLTEMCNENVTLADDGNKNKRSMTDDICENNPNEKRMKLHFQDSEYMLPLRYYSDSHVECDSDNRFCTQTYVEDDITRERDFLLEERCETKIQHPLGSDFTSEDKTHRGMYKCTYCGVMMKKHELRKHILIAHELICETRGKFVSSSSILYGSKFHSSTNSKAREIARQEGHISTRDGMNVSSQVHNRYNFCHKCGFCGRVFDNATKLRTHIGNHVRQEIHGQQQQKVVSTEELSLILKYL